MICRYIKMKGLHISGMWTCVAVSKRLLTWVASLFLLKQTLQLKKPGKECFMACQRTRERNELLLVRCWEKQKRFYSVFTSLSTNVSHGSSMTIDICGADNCFYKCRLCLIFVCLQLICHLPNPAKEMKANVGKPFVLLMLWYMKATDFFYRGLQYKPGHWF